ncbi:MAG TPA: UPF0149 family protein [Caulobacteraceae bacterium]|nr:UPF0149 family protein [Caulobacteraceae bacterium]
MPNVSLYYRWFEQADGRALPGSAPAEAVFERVAPLMRRAEDGAFLILPDQQRIRAGLCALAMARHAPAAPALLSLLRLPDEELDTLLGDLYLGDLPGLVYGIVGDDLDGLEALALDDSVSEFHRWEAVKALALLARDGRASRERTVAFLDRFDREQLARPDSHAWFGWEEAVLLLGLFDWEPRVRAGWAEGRRPEDAVKESADWLLMLEQARASPDDIFSIIEDHSWLATAGADDIPAMIRSLAEPQEAGAFGELTADEQDWLVRLMRSEAWQDAGGASPEEAEGYVAALAVGPGDCDPAETLRRLSRPTDTDDGPTLDRDVAAYAEDLIARDVASVRRQLEAGQPLNLEWPGDRLPAQQAWAVGFVAAVIERQGAWDALRLEEDARPYFEIIAQVAASDDVRSPREERNLRDMADGMGFSALSLYRFWRAPHRFVPFPRPIQSVKVGRNDPCPCGSGKKYKKCCGAAA